MSWKHSNIHKSDKYLFKNCIFFLPFSLLGFCNCIGLITTISPFKIVVNFRRRSHWLEPPQPHSYDNYCKWFRLSWRNLTYNIQQPYSMYWSKMNLWHQEKHMKKSNANCFVTDTTVAGLSWCIPTQKVRSGALNSPLFLSPALCCHVIYFSPLVSTVDTFPVEMYIASVV